MSDFVAWVKEQVRKSHIKELIKTHTGLTPPAFIAVVALAAAGTALTVSAVSSFLAPPKKNDTLLESIINNEIMPHTPTNNQRELSNMIPVFLDTPIAEVTKEEEEGEEEEEAPASDIDAPVKEQVEASANDIDAPVKEQVEAPAKEETVETTTSTSPDAEDSTSSDYVDVEETIA